LQQETSDNYRSQELPHRLTRFIGREIELVELKRLLQERRLVTLTGAGGSGKTRLALEIAGTLADDFAGGIFFVEMAPLTSAELVIETVARVLGVEAATGAPLLDRLTHFLGTRNSLLVLDNCEHLLDECARLAGALLATCPHLRVLVTSRQPLGVSGECIFRVPLLSLPGPGQLLDPDEFMGFESIQLFVDRARLANSGFALSEINAEAVARVCIRLDGVPLALELAAAALRALTVSHLAARLDQRFKLLTSGDRTALPRQQTLGAMLDWSHALLTQGEQIVFRRLAVFPGGDWTLDAAEYICADASSHSETQPTATSENVLDALINLVDKSLVQLDAIDGRYRMLETIRLYAGTKLDEAHEMEEGARRHLEWYLRFVEDGVKQEGTSDQHAWYMSLDTELDNIRAALNWAIEEHLSEEAARLALAVHSFWIARAYHREGLRWMEQVLSLDSVAPINARLKVRLLNALGFLAQEVKRFEQASQYYNEALELLQELGDSGGLIASVLNLGWKSFVAAEVDAAERHAEEGLALAMHAGDLRSTGVALNLLTSARLVLGKLDGLAPAIEEALAIWRRLGDLHEVANTLVTYSQVERVRGNLEHACALFLEALHLDVSLGTYGGLVGPLVSMSQFALYACNPPEKYIYFARAIGVMEALEERIGGERSPWVYIEVFPLYDQLKAALGEEGFAREVAEGHDLPVEGIVALAESIVHSVLALSSTVESSAAPSLPSSAVSIFPAGLTPREVEVLTLVAAGLTNQQAADRLSVTPRTIGAHLTTIYGKLGVTSRAGAIRFALENDLR
jgi:non-specific serine/threonine protein kinase